MCRHDIAPAACWTSSWPPVSLAVGALWPQEALVVLCVRSTRRRILETGKEVAEGSCSHGIPTHA